MTAGQAETSVVEGLLTGIRDGDRIFVSSGACEPPALVEALVQDVAVNRAELTVLQILAGASGQTVGMAGRGHRVRTPVPARWAGAPRVESLDMSMKQWCLLLAMPSQSPDVALVTGTLRDGRIFPVPAVDVATVALRRARFRAVELIHSDVPVLPREAGMNVTEFDLVLDTGSQLQTFPSPNHDHVSRQIGTCLAEIIPDGSVIEIGVGRSLAGIADGIITAQKSVGIHTGLISDWGKSLIQAGAANRPLDCADGRSAVAAIAMGSQEFQNWFSQTDDVALVDSYHAHDPHHLGGHTPFIAINSAVAVGLNGAVGFPDGYTNRHGPGGLMDFAAAGAFSGMSVIAVNSKSSRGHSRIVPQVVDTQLPPSLVTHIVTEHGAVDIRGTTISERSSLLTSIAHPEVRDELRQSA